MNKRITLQQRNVIKDSACNETEGWQDYYSCYAAVVNAKTDVEVSNAEQQNKQEIVFFMRSCKKVEIIINQAKKFRIVFNGFCFDIKNADNYGYSHDRFKITAVVSNEQNINK